MDCPHCKTKGVKTPLIKRVERGGLLLQGRAPIVRLVEGVVVLEQRCPVCRTLTNYRPQHLRLVVPKRNQDHAEATPDDHADRAAG